MTLEAKFAQRLKEKSESAVTPFYREVMKTTNQHELEEMPWNTFAYLLSSWGFDLDSHDRSVMMHRYQSSLGVSLAHVCSMFPVYPIDFSPCRLSALGITTSKAADTALLATCLS